MKDQIKQTFPALDLKNQRDYTRTIYMITFWCASTLTSFSVFNYQIPKWTPQDKARTQKLFTEKSYWITYDTHINPFVDSPQSAN